MFKSDFGLWHEVCKADDVVSTAISEAARLGAYVKQPAFRLTKDLERRGMADEVLARIDQDVNGFTASKSKL